MFAFGANLVAWFGDIALTLTHFAVLVDLSCSDKFSHDSLDSMISMICSAINSSMRSTTSSTSSVVATLMAKVLVQQLVCAV